MQLDVPSTARLFAEVNEVAAEASIAFMAAKYHYLFWRPVTAIDPTSVHADGFGLVPGPDDGNPLTVEQPGWRPLLPTPNHPEYPSAHSTVTAAIMEVVTHFLGTDQIEVDIMGNAALNATRHYATAEDLLTDVRNGRIWAGLHYRFSTNAGAAMGREIGAVRRRPRLQQRRLRANNPQLPAVPVGRRPEYLGRRTPEPRERSE